MPLVFLSYASDDNRKPKDDESKGWVDAFREVIELELPRIVKNGKLWFDKRDFDEPGAVRDRLSEGIKQAEFLLPVLSTSYGDKEYTTYELVEFFGAMNAKGRDPADFIIPLLPYPLPEEQFPSLVSGLKWVSFFDTDDAGGFKPFFDGFGREHSPKYWDAVREVVKLIDRRVKLLQQQEKPTATVYVAQPALDQYMNHRSVTNELVSKKCRVTPKLPWPVNEPETASYLGKALSEAQFSVHLLGATQGKENRSGLTRLTARQLDLAAERQKQDEKFRRLIFIPSDLKASDPEQEALITSLDDGSRLTDRDEFVRGGLEQFKSIIHDELERSGAGASL